MQNIHRDGGVISLSFGGIGKALSDHFLQVPRFQRGYAWEEENVSELFLDIATAINDKEEVYFLGSIVTVQTQNGRLEVVDGQQRLATISMLLAAIRDYFHEKKDSKRKEFVEDKFLLSTSLETLDKEQRLLLNASDNEFFLKRVLTESEARPSPVETPKTSHQRIERASELAAERVQKIVQETNDPFGKLNEWVLYITNNVKVIWFTVSNEANAFMIFETLNDRGLELTISDLLKNYLFSRSNKRLREVEEQWLSMVNTFEAIERPELIVRFIHNYWSSRFGLTRERELYDNIKKKITSTSEVVEFTSDLAIYARLFVALLNPDHDLWQRFDDNYGQYKVRDCVRTLNILRLEQYRPLLLAVLRHFDDKEIARSLQMMVSWTVRLLINGGGGGTLEKRYPELAAKISNGTIHTAEELSGLMADIVPNDKQFQAAFSTVSISRAYLARYLLNALEMNERGGVDPELVPNDNTLAVNLEHILPDKLSTNWQSVSEEDHKAYRNRLGNLALLGSKRNSAIKDASFEDKKRVFQDSDMKLTQMIAEKDKWTRAEIEERQIYLSKLAIKVWPYKPRMV